VAAGERSQILLGLAEPRGPGELVAAPGPAAPAAGLREEPQAVFAVLKRAGSWPPEGGRRPALQAAWLGPPKGRLAHGPRARGPSTSVIPAASPAGSLRPRSGREALAGALEDSAAARVEKAGCSTSSSPHSSDCYQYTDFLPLLPYPPARLSRSWTRQPWTAGETPRPRARSASSSRQLWKRSARASASTSRPAS